jgi:hypothetical protein
MMRRSLGSLRCFTLAAVVALLVGAAAVAAPQYPAGFGCFVEAGRLTTPWPQTCANMAAAGMNTMAFYPRNEADLIYQMETALAAGAIDSEHFVILVSNMPPLHPGPDNTNEREWLELPGRVDAARAKAPNGKRWPEIVLYGTDEPSRAEQVIEWACAYHAGGYRCTTALCTPNVKDFVPYLDLLIIHCSPGVLTRENIAAVESAGKQWGVYNVQLRCASPDLMRYYAGLWTYKLAGCAVNLMWEWQWYAEDNPRGPARPDLLAAYRRGVDDYRMLTAARRYPLDLDFWPGICGAQREAWKADFNKTAGKCVPTNPVVRP